MALYEYRCPACGNEFEQRRPMSQADGPADCPSCGEESRRLPSVFASKEGYTLRVPRGEAFRQGQPGQN